MYPVGTQRILRRLITSLMHAPDAFQECISVKRSQELATAAYIELSGATVERFFVKKIYKNYIDTNQNKLCYFPTV